MIWGFKPVEQRLGYVADFCPICREITALDVYGVRRVAHVYYLGLGKGKLVGYIGKCQVCGTSIPVDPKKYSKFLDCQEENINALIEQTYPQVMLERADRLEIERRIKFHEPIPLEQRRQLLMEPFGVLAGRVEKVFWQVPLDNRTKVGCSILLLLIMIAGCVTLVWLEDAPAVSLVMGILWILLMGIGVVYVFVEAFLTPRRIVQREIIPLLAKTLAPLRPTQEELEHVLKVLKGKGWKIGKVVKAEKVYMEVMKLRKR